MGLIDRIKDEKAERLRRAAEWQQQKAEANEAADAMELRKHGLLLDDTSDAEIREKNAQSLRRIVGESGWSKYWSVGTTFSDAADKVQINLLKMLTEQQFIIIRQNEQIIRLLSKK